MRHKWNFLHRKKLVTYPRPVVIFTPIIIDYIEKNIPKKKNLLFDLNKQNKNIVVDFSYKN